MGEISGLTQGKVVNIILRKFTLRQCFAIFLTDIFTGKKKILIKSNLFKRLDKK